MTFRVSFHSEFYAIPRAAAAAVAVFVVLGASVCAFFPRGVCVREPVRFRFGFFVFAPIDVRFFPEFARLIGDFVIIVCVHECRSVSVRVCVCDMTETPIHRQQVLIRDPIHVLFFICWALFLSVECLCLRPKVGSRMDNKCFLFGFFLGRVVRSVSVCVCVCVK